MKTAGNKQDFLFVSGEVATIAKNAGIVFILIILGGFLMYVFDFLSARYLGPELFGVFFLGCTLIGILEKVAILGVNNGVLRYASISYGSSDLRGTKGVIVTGAKIVFFWGLILSATTFLFSDYIATRFFRKEGLSLVLKIICFGIVFSALGDVLGHSLQAFRQPKYKELTRKVIEPGVGIVFLLISIIVGYKLAGVAAAYLLGILTAAFFSFYFLIKKFPFLVQVHDYRRFSAVSMLSFSWPLLFVGFLTYFMKQVNTVFLGYFHDAVTIAIYAVAYKTAFLIIIILNSFIAIFAPMMADLHNRNALDKLSILFKIVTKWVFTISFALFLILVLLSKEIMGLWGQQYIGGWLNLVIIGFAQLVNCSVGPTGYMIMMSGKSRLSLLNVCVTVLATVVFSYFFVPRYADLGAAVSMGLAIILINIITLLEVISIFKFHPYRIDFWKPLLSGTITFFIMNVFLRIYVLEGAILRLIVISASFILLYIFMLIISGIEDEDRLVLDKIIAKLPIKR